MESPTLGKRKEREEEAGAHGSTLFVSNLPYTVTSVDLQTLFSDIAPVRSAFIVTQQGTGVSKGVGYVAFAIKEDAQTAYDKITTEGISIAGRHLRIQWAGQKTKDSKEGQDEPTKPKEKKRREPQAARPKPKGADDPSAIRTLVVTGLPASVDSKSTLWKKFRKYAGAEGVEWPLENNTAHVTFASASAASQALEKLHAHIYKGSILSVTLKKRLDTTAKPNNASRLIVRNIPFHTTEQDLRSIFLPYGPVHTIHIPRKTDGRMRGFAFVWMLSKKDAERAMEKCNGLTMKPGLADSLASDKQKRKKLRRLEKKNQAGEVGEDEEEEAPARTIAVDWALSKDKWEEEKSKLEADEEGSGSSDSDSNSDSDSDAGSDSDASNIGVHDDKDSSNSEAGLDDSDDERDDEPVRPQLPTTDVGTTLFVRNIPFEATEDELRILFRAFGRLRYARITVDPISGRSRGTGFACFWEKEDADKVIEHSDLLRAETTGSAPVVKKNPFVLPSILTPDPSSSLAKSLVLHGRTLDVVRAVTRDVASRLKEEGERQREKADKRNIYLLREGVILPNSPAAENMPQAELERRTNSYGARKTLLNSNPSLYVSKTRLSIRQVPMYVSEKVLKKLALHATKAFEEDVKKGDRSPLSKDELAVDRDMEEQEKEKEKEAAQKDGEAKKGGPRKLTGKVKQAKIVRQQDKVDPVTGRARSKGYGFLETHTHTNALRVLRWANNNPGVPKLLGEWYKDELKELIKVEKGKKPEEREDGRIKRLTDALESPTPPAKSALIVEFSIENVQVVQRRATHTTAGARDGKSKEGERERGNKRKKGKDTTADEDTKDERPPAKKSKPNAVGDTGEKAKNFNPLGSIIGKKRKERKGKKSS